MFIWWHLESTHFLPRFTLQWISQRQQYILSFYEWGKEKENEKKKYFFYWWFDLINTNWTNGILFSKK